MLGLWVFFVVLALGVSAPIQFPLEEQASQRLPIEAVNKRLVSSTWALQEFDINCTMPAGAHGRV